MRKFINLIEGVLPIDEGKTLPLIKGQLPRFRGLYAAFVCVMRPEDFLELTTSDQAELDSIKNRAFPYDREKYDRVFDGTHQEDFNRFEIPFLFVSLPSGKIKGHEGRHRSAMVLRNGGRSVPVMICPQEDDRYEVTDTYWDDDWNDHLVSTEFDSYRDARDHEWKQLKGEIPAPEGMRHQKSDMKTLRGNKLRGAPDRSEGWDHAAWRIEDFPKQLIGQYNDWTKVTRFKVGLVKGYKHHRR